MSGKPNVPEVVMGASVYVCEACSNPHLGVLLTMDEKFSRVWDEGVREEREALVILYAKLFEQALVSLVESKPKANPGNAGDSHGNPVWN